MALSIHQDMLQEIGDYLSLKDLISLTQVSKQHYDHVSKLVTQRMQNQEWECTIWFNNDERKKGGNSPLIGIIYPCGHDQQGKDYLDRQDKMLTNIAPPSYFAYRRNKHQHNEKKYYLGKQLTLFFLRDNHCYLDKSIITNTCPLAWTNIPIYTNYQKGAIYCYVVYS